MVRHNTGMAENLPPHTLYGGDVWHSSSTSIIPVSGLKDSGVPISIRSRHGKGVTQRSVSSASLVETGSISLVFRSTASTTVCCSRPDADCP